MAITCLIYTLNEERNLPKCLESLRWCDDVIVVDSFSTDGTERVARQFGAKFVQHEFTGFGDQREWSLTQLAIRHPWALVLDADECVPPSLRDEMLRVVRTAPADVAAFRVRRRFYLWGRWLRRSAFYPTWVTRLIRVGRVRYFNRGHSESEAVHGRVLPLHEDLHDENLKGFDDWRARQIGYCRREAEYELSLPRLRLRELLAGDPLRRRAAQKHLLRRLPLRPALFFLYAYVLRMGFLEGSAGFRFCLERARFEALIVRLRRELQRAARSAATGPPGHVPASDHSAIDGGSTC